MSATEKINTEIKIIYIDTDKLVPYSRNPRINDSAVDKVAQSITENGFKVPIIIDKKNVIVCGHTRLKAAKQLGITRLPCVMADDLSSAQIKRMRLQENKTHDYSFWDDAMLSAEIQELEDAGVEMNDLFDEMESDAADADADAEIKPEVTFTEEVLESHNYVVLYFDNEVDWLQAQTIFGIHTVEGFSTKKDGNGKRKKFGVGRVIRGAEFLKSLVEGAFNT